jgi:hypothetical protein
MQAAIEYLRVSTREQGRSGLGLAAQRHEIEAFGEREGLCQVPGIRMCRPVQVQTLCCCDQALRQPLRRRRRPGAR